MLSDRKIIFLEKAKRTHNNKYDYSKTKYKNAHTKIIIICPIHGEFKQTPHNHLCGKGCARCAGNQKLTIDEFIKRAKKTHGDKYDYSKTEYNGKNIKIEIICPRHGKFMQLPLKHLSGQNCSKCSNNYPLTTKEFINKSNIIHNNKYDYSKTKYKSINSKIIIICPTHGEFKQFPHNHLYNKCGCPYCVSIISRNHQEIINYLYTVYDGPIKINDRKRIYPFELDIYLPEINLAIEHNGIYFHSYLIGDKNENKMRHYNKYLICKDLNITLIQIFEDEWTKNKKIIKEILYKYLNNNYISSDKNIIINNCYPLQNIDDYKLIETIYPQNRLVINKSRRLWDAGFSVFRILSLF